MNRKIHKQLIVELYNRNQHIVIKEMYFVHEGKKDFMLVFCLAFFL